MVLASVGLGRAQGAGESSIQTCVNNSSGVIKVIAAGEACKNNETAYKLVLDVDGQVSASEGFTAGTATTSYLDGRIISSKALLLDVGGNLLLDVAGDVGIGTRAPAEKLDVAGNISVDGTVDGVDVAALESTVSSLSEPADPPCFSNSHRYTDCGNGTVTDGVTGLIWLKDARCKAEKDWKDANDWAAALADGACDLSDGSSAGDWRLPTTEEWEIMIEEADADGCDPRISDAKGTGCWSEGDLFSTVKSDRYWSSTSLTNGAQAWAVALWVSGIFSNTGKPAHYFAWPVRVGP